MLIKAAPTSALLQTALGGLPNLLFLHTFPPAIVKKQLLAAGLLLGFSTAASAQSNAVKINIFSPLVKTGSFFYEHKISEQNSVQLGALFTRWNAGYTDITGFAITPEYRFYLSDKKPAMQGFYLGPFLRYQNLTLNNGLSYTEENIGIQHEAKASLNTLGGGLVAGHQFVFKRRFTLDTYLGPSYNGGKLKVKAGEDSQDFDTGAFRGFGLRSGVTFGIAF